MVVSSKSMEPNYTPLKTNANQKKSGTDPNGVLIVIALGITILLGAMLWFMIQQKKQQELELNKTIQQPQQIIKDVVVEESPSVAVTPEASQSAIIE